MSLHRQMHNTITEELIATLRSLPFFSSIPIQHVSRLTGGFSHDVYRIDCSANQQPLKTSFVAKLVKGRSTRLAELNAANVAFKYGIGPEVLYADQNWMITRYINGISLAQSCLSTKEKLAVCLPLLSKLHNIPIKNERLGNCVTKLDIKLVLNKLIESSERPQRDKDTLNQIVVDHVSESEQAPLVYVHGDCNFSNVFISQEHSKERVSQLIDFEAVSLAVPEYELGMFMAVNTINQVELECGFNYYKNQTTVCLEKVTRYAVLSCVINALWYEQQAANCLGNNYRIKAEEQCQFLTLLTESKYKLMVK